MGSGWKQGHNDTMPKYETTIDIAASPQRVWDVLADVERWPDWTKSMTRVTLLDPGPLTIGVRARVEQPKLRPAILQVTVWDPPRLFIWENRLPGLRAIAAHRVEPHGAGARATLSVDFRGLLGWPVGWLVGRLTRRYIAMEAAGLKVCSEAHGGKAHGGKVYGGETHGSEAQE